jgi:hypothetical protein
MKTELSPAEEQALRQKTINETEPGAILRDFATLLEWVASNELKVSGTKQLLPQAILGELNASMSQPIRVDIQRPVQKSFPNLNGLYLVLRASGLSRIEQRGKHAVLTLDETMMARWHDLNLPERYVALLEAWWVRSTDEILGERDPQGPFIKCTWLWQKFQEKPAITFGKNRDDNSFLNYFPGLHNLALLDLFGFVRVTAGKPLPGKGWNVTGIEVFPFGAALFHLVRNAYFEWIEDALFLPGVELEAAQSLLALLQPYFPALENQLILPLPAKREGLFVFKVSLGKIWRRIAIPSSLTLDDLSYAILDSVDFDSDHLYQFTFRNQLGRKVEVGHPYMEDVLSSAEVCVGDLPLQVGEAMDYLFDFGDNWEFDVLLEKIEPAEAKLKKPQLLESHGKAPEQYPHWDDEGDDEMEEEEERG